MNHDAGVGKRIALALGAGRQKEGPHRSGHAHADRLHVRLDELHRVVDAQTGVNRSARAIDVERNILVGIFTFKEQQLGNHKICRFVVDFARQEHDAVAQQTRINIEAAFTAAALFDHHRDQCVLNVVHDLIFRLLELRLTGRAVKNSTLRSRSKLCAPVETKTEKSPWKLTPPLLLFPAFVYLTGPWYGLTAGASEPVGADQFARNRIIGDPCRRAARR